MNKVPTLILLLLLTTFFAGCAGANPSVPTTAQPNATTNAQNQPYPATDMQNNSYPSPDASPTVQPNTTTSAQNNVVAPTPQAPAPDKATVVGRALSLDGTPLVDTPVRLAETYYQGSEGAYALDGARSPGARTDSAGFFAMPDIPAREYVVIVGDIQTPGAYVVISKESDLPETFNIEEGKILDLGELKVNL